MTRRAHLHVSDEDIAARWASYDGEKRGAVRALADGLGVPRHWVSQRLMQMGLTAPHKKEPNWTAAEDALIPTLPLHNPKRAATIMRAHGYVRTPTAIVIRARRLEISRRASHDTFSAAQAANIVGIDPKTIGQHCEQGLISAEKMDDARTPQQGGHRWAIKPDALRAYVREQIASIDLRRVDKLAFFALIDQPTPAMPAPAIQDRVKGWTPEKRLLASRRFGETIIQVAWELNVPANELLAYSLHGEVPRAGAREGFAETRLPEPEPEPAERMPAALPAPPLGRSRAGVLSTMAEQRRAASVALVPQIRALAGTMSVSAIEAQVGLGKSTLYKLAHEHGFSLATSESTLKIDVAELRRLAATLDRPALARHFDVAPSAITHMAKRHGIAILRGRQGGVGKVWSDAQLERLRALAGKESPRLIAVAVGRGVQSVYNKARELGLSLDLAWTPERVAELQALAGTLPPGGLAKHFHVNVGSVTGEAGRRGISLKMTVAIHPWEADLKRLAGSVSFEGLMKRFGVSKAMLRSAANRQGLSLRVLGLRQAPRVQRPKQPSVWTEERVAEVRRLAAEERSATEIGVIVGAGRMAVIGLCHRKGIKLSGKSVRRPATPKPAAPKTSKAPQVRQSQQRVDDGARARSLPTRAGFSTMPAPVMARPNRRATVMAPTQAKWVRLRHPDGRWLRMDGLAWVEKREASYLVKREKLPAVLRAFELARQCVVIDEPAWQSRLGDRMTA